jgi:D-alanyl-D-alanine dipeptidase
MTIFKRLIPFLLCLTLVFTVFWFPRGAWGGSLPKGFVYIDEAVPGLVVDIRYYTDHNFVGERIDGYTVPRGILTVEAAEALGKVQEELGRFGLGLKVFDAYRPQRAVDHFVRWAKDTGNVRMKKEFYPDVNKEDLFRDAYIVEKSGHSRGSTVDLTIVSLDARSPGVELDMGTAFDYFGPKSWSSYLKIEPGQRANRMLLHEVMEKHGFKSYPQEWWHFTLAGEPYPSTCFDFPIR